ncbi:hypothetical protein PCA31118_03927 [Pandoraea captiosa]|uniref:Uncharacterized protein n=1 Tax=Pandoraea captiosa TaxID=2508302 RepID=A0A5E5AEU7_9BURK|nr:hypothetical protein [Pandoraea captiosa]VVE71626.1 hypothetical protein PCA31118_03927 [Pandoraea captiosa]
MLSNNFAHNGDAIASHLQAVPAGTDAQVGAVECATRGRKRRFTKLRASELVGLPGATSAVTKPVERDVAFIQFAVPVTNSVGTAAESLEIVEFSSGLNEQGRTLQIGSVCKVGFGEGTADVVLKLDAPVDPTNHGSAVADAFGKLNDFLTSAQVLRADRSGRRATWRAKINGTTIADGRY